MSAAESENNACCVGDTCNCTPKRLHLLKSREFLLTVWLLLAAFTVLHYASPSSLEWAHDVLRRAYYLPIVIASLRSGLTGGLIVTGVVTLAYLPHAFMHQHHFDPGDTLEKLLEIVLYFVVAWVAGYMSDLEARRRIQLTRAVEEQKALTEQLARAGRLAALGEVVAGIAHEIKNPLHALAGTAEVIDAEIAPQSPIHRMWELHKSEIQRLRKTADTFLSFARPNPIVRAPVDLNDVALRLHDLAAAQARKQHIEIRLDLAEKAVVVDGDLDQLAQVALNIALNALKAMETSGTVIRISTGTQLLHEMPHAYIRIENNGPPIPIEDRENLFNPFHSGLGGTGLGLSISDRIVRQHNGYIEISEGTLGVSFTVVIPTAAALNR